MRYLTLASIGLSVLALVAGCAADNASDETADDDVVARGPGATCTQVIAERNQHVAELVAKGGKLTINESSTNGKFAPKTYSMSRVMLFAEPSGEPNYECSEGRSVIKVWDGFARVNAAYYRLTSEQPTEPEVFECSALLDPTNQHTVNMSFDGEELTVLQTSINGRFAPQKFALSRVMLAKEPSGDPLFACEQPGAYIALWSGFARVNSSYYRVSER